MGPHASLETERLRLEPWAPAHAEFLVVLSSTPAVMRHIGSGQVRPRADAEEAADRLVQHWEDHGFGWRAAIEMATGEPVGLVALQYAGEGLAGLAPHDYEIGWWLSPQHWGRGLAREGGKAVRDEAFSRLNAPSVVARIRPENTPSIAVAMALGLTREFSAIGKSGEPTEVYRRRLSVS